MHIYIGTTVWAPITQVPETHKGIHGVFFTLKFFDLLSICSWCRHSLQIYQKVNVTIFTRPSRYNCLYMYNSKQPVILYCFLQVEPTKVELVPGYGVVITQRQFDEAIRESNGSPTRLIWNLMWVFFTREELARSSCYGSPFNAALDKDIIFFLFFFL